ncbi:MAG: type II secretion system F family protein [Desulfobacterales bacterium]
MTAIMSQPTIFIYGAAFLALFLFCLGVSQFIRQRDARREIIEKIRGGEGSGTAIEEEPIEISAGTKSGSRIVNAFGKLGKFAAPVKPQDYSSVRLKFLRAGIQYENATASFWGAKILLMACLPLIFLILRFQVFQVMTYQMTILSGVLCSLFGFYLPDIWLRQKTDKRKEKVLNALPDALDLLVVCVEAGMGLDSAIYRVAQETKLNHPELSDEFQLINLEMRAGKKRKDALKNLALRTSLEEINSLVTLLIQTDQFGTSLADALRVYADSFRTQRYQRAEEKAAKLPVTLIFPLVIFIFPALFVVLLGPAAISIYNALLKP